MSTLQLLLPLLLAFFPTAPGADPAQAAKIARIQRHFDGALAMLQRADVSGLSESARANRIALTTELARYRDRAQFPINYDFPGVAIPYFVDRKTGVRCAVGNLMEFSGRPELVSRLAAANNNAWVDELAADAEIRAWLDEQGLTLAEAARIQVPYAGEGCFECPSARRADVGPSPTAHAVVIGAALTSAVLPGAFPAASRSRVAGFISVTIGIAGLATAGASWQDPDSRTYALATAASSAISLYTASRTFSRARVARTNAAESRTRVGLILPTSPAQGTGLSVSFAF